MISKAQSKFIKSLQIKKYRKQEQCFVVEGKKSVDELLKSSLEIVMLVGTEEYLGQFNTLPKAEVVKVTERELNQLGDFQTNEEALAVARIPEPGTPRIASDNLTLVLDDIRDPGNLGTILRTADWYGITTVVASPETVDCYSPKVVNATMGSFTRVNVHYEELPGFLATVNCPVYGAYLEGTDVHSIVPTTPALLVIGNESHGISNVLDRFITHPVTIPRYGQAESLNAGIATAILLDVFRTRMK